MKKETVEELAKKHQKEIQKAAAYLVELMDLMKINVLKFEAKYTSEKKINIEYEFKR